MNKLNFALALLLSTTEAKQEDNRDNTTMLPSAEERQFCRQICGQYYTGAMKKMCNQGCNGASAKFHQKKSIVKMQNEYDADPCKCDSGFPGQGDDWLDCWIKCDPYTDSLDPMEDTTYDVDPCKCDSGFTYGGNDWANCWITCDPYGDESPYGEESKDDIWATDSTGYEYDADPCGCDAWYTYGSDNWSTCWIGCNPYSKKKYGKGLATMDDMSECIAYCEAYFGSNPQCANACTEPSAKFYKKKAEKTLTGLTFKADPRGCDKSFKDGTWQWNTCWKNCK